MAVSKSMTKEPAMCNDGIELRVKQHIVSDKSGRCAKRGPAGDVHQAAGRGAGQAGGLGGQGGRSDGAGRGCSRGEARGAQAAGGGQDGGQAGLRPGRRALYPPHSRGPDGEGPPTSFFTADQYERLTAEGQQNSVGHLSTNGVLQTF
eukprot:scaffold374982_cov34-Prasinocladus_malaysianus.AAC.1